MRSYRSATKRHELLLVSATMVAHANALESGFRQRDVRRIIEYAVSWGYPETDEGEIPYENTQIRRYLDWLASEGFARKLSKGKQPCYQLTRQGIIELISSITDRRYYYNRGEFFYLYFILTAYKKRITSLVANEGKRFPYSFRLEFESLFDADAAVKNQLAGAKRELKILTKRMEDQLLIAEYVTNEIKKGVPYEELTKDIEKRFYSSIQSSLPVWQLLPSLTPKQALWELTEGNYQRCKSIFAPTKEAIECHIKQLEQLLGREAVRTKSGGEVSSGQ